MRLPTRDYGDLRGIMIGRGLPRALARARGVMMACDVHACTHADTRTTITASRQRTWLEDCMREPIGDWVMVVGTLRDPDLVHLLGVEFFARATRDNIQHPGGAGRPLWRAVVGGWSDRLRDDSSTGRAYREEVGRVGALVLSGVTHDCPPEKMEKVRDLIHLHEGVPRVVLLSGGDPLQFAYDRLHRRATRIVHVNRSSARADRGFGREI